MTKQMSPFRKVLGVCRKLGKWFGFVFLFYCGVVLVGLFPANNDFQPTPDGIEIGIVSNAVHTDLVLPIRNDVKDWRSDFPSSVFTRDVSRASHVAIGWGDRGFFIQTPTWSDMTIGTALKALFWLSPTCIHVDMTSINDYSSVHKVRISEEQYQQLVAYVESSFRLDETGEKLLIEGEAYYGTDAFYESKGTYHCLNTCNSWAGRALRESGIRVPLMTPLPKSASLYFPDSD